MYDLFKYYDILELEEQFKDKFNNINPSKNIAVLPPVIKKYHGKYILAYLVMSQPESHDHHYGVTRPIGAILRNYRTKKIIRVVNCKNEEFAPEKNDFVREYYDLEDHEDWWPNRNTDNEELYRILLEKLYKTCKTIKLFKPYKKSYYDDYLNTAKKLFSEEYWYFFEALQNNPIKDLDEEIIYQRDLAKKEHEVRSQKRQEQQLVETSKARELFVEEIKESMQNFILKEICPTLKNKPNYAKIDFYKFIGNMLKSIYFEPNRYLNCYNSALTPKALTNNKDALKETLKVDMIKTYAKACVKPTNEDKDVNNLCEMYLKFLNTMLEQEQLGVVSEQTKATINKCMNYYNTQIEKIQNDTIKEEMQEIYNDLLKDYYETTDPKHLSNVYLGYSLSNKSYKEDEE